MAAKPGKIERFIATAAQECAELGVSLIFKEEEEDEELTAGWFSAASKELIVTTKNDDFIQILAHELGHLRQYKEGLFKDESAYVKYEEWLAGHIDASMTEIIRCTRYCALCELNAETRAVEMLKEFRLTNAAGIKKYIQQANAHVLMYELGRRYRKWSWRSDKMSPMRNRKIYGLLPTSLITNTSDVPDDFEAAVVDLCFD